ncbi:MAG: hypothetical protein PHN64_07020 [Desulfovibrionaceae bacterium]|nr:hypothetical protein [Desulfovibrionaceae bacterium]
MVHFAACAAPLERSALARAGSAMRCGAGLAPHTLLAAWAQYTALLWRVFVLCGLAHAGRYSLCGWAGFARRALLPRLSAVRSYCLWCSLGLCLACLAGCAGRGDGRAEAEQLAQSHGLRHCLFQTENFALFGLLRAGTGSILRVYIEGDGRAWLTRTRPSTDPTPQNPVALRLAVADPSRDTVLYLARPCQFVQGADRRQCARRFWTNARFAENVIASLNEAISTAKAQAGAKQVALFGYSGGGGAAVLLAARRSDVVFLATVAGNVHSAAWTQHHKVSPLVGSLEPFDAASAVRGIAQWHISGAEDDIMPPALSQQFCQKVGAAAHCQTIAHMRHDGAWQEHWLPPAVLP